MSFVSLARLRASEAVEHRATIARVKSAREERMTAASTSTTTETRAETLERFEPKDAIPNDAFDAMILEWRDHPRVRVRGRGESRWEAWDAATTAALSATWALGPCACAVWAFRRVMGGRKDREAMGVKRRRALVAYLAMECGWYEYRRRVGLKFCEYTNMKATPTRKDFDRFLQLRYDGVLDFNAYLRGWTKTWKKLAFYGGSTEETSPPSSPPPRTSTPGANNAPAEANFHRETALDFLRFGFHDALRPEEIGEQKERELRFFMDEIEAHWDLRFDDKAEKESFEFMFHTKEKLGAFHQPLLFTAWVNGVAGVTGLVLHAWGFTLRHGSNGCAYWTNSEVTTEDWKSRTPKTVVVTTRHGRGRETKPVLCGAIKGKRDDETRPIVFIHGLGVGLAPYLPHIAQLLRSKPRRKIALLTLPHISMRAVPRVPELDDMVDTVVEITKKHAFREPTLYGHSFGTFVVARACQRYCVSSVVLIDPVAVCLCLPQTVSILYQLNKSWVDFKRRVSEGPRALFSSDFWHEGGSLLYFCLRDYFLLREIGVMTALRRKFWWARYNLWADDLPEDSLVVLEGNDLLIDTDAIARHVLRQSKARIIYQDRFAHGEFASPWGFGLRDEIVQFLDKDDPYL